MRILAGAHKGRKLSSPPAGGRTRPITGSAKKSLFDTVGRRLDGAVVVDLYCGTGTQGLEALSRGARRCYFAERDRGALLRLRRNIEMLAVGERCTIWPGDVTRRLRHRLARTAGPVDVAFVDPPYADARRWSWERVGGRIFSPLADRLSGGGLVVLRLPAKVDVPEVMGSLAVLRRKVYGDMALVFLGVEL